MTNPGDAYSIQNLLLQWNSIGETPGIHQFQAKFFRSDGTTVVASPAQTVSLMVDNNPAEVQILNILHNGNPVPACAIETMSSASDGLRFRITANDVEGHLQSYSLAAFFGDNQSATIVSDSYASHMTPTHIWNGVTNVLVPGSVWVPPISCAYQFRVSAWPRVTNGYTYLGGVEFNRHVTIIKPGAIAMAVPQLISKEFPLGMSGKKGPDVSGNTPTQLGAATFAGASGKAIAKKKPSARKTPSKKAAAKTSAGKKAKKR